jgi:hypothetical protein
MLMSAIRRTSFEVVDFREDVEQLATSAETLLGYKALRKSTEAPLEDKVLRHTLAALCIDTLIAADVETYQRERLLETTRAALERWAATVTGEIKPYIVFHGPRWEDTPIEQYAEAIPLHVVERLVRIKERLPEVNVTIVHLEETPDPFARVWMGKDIYRPTESFWVDVWEEPRFEAARQR